MAYMLSSACSGTSNAQAPQGPSCVSRQFAGVLPAHRPNLVSHRSLSVACQSGCKKSTSAAIFRTHHLEALLRRRSLSAVPQHRSFQSGRTAVVQVTQVRIDHCSQSQPRRGQHSMPKVGVRSLFTIFLIEEAWLFRTRRKSHAILGDLSYGRMTGITARRAY
jgi:hypothetical protein